MAANDDEVAALPPVAVSVPVAALEAAEAALAVRTRELASAETALGALREELSAARAAAVDAQQALAHVTERLVAGAEGELVKLALGIAERVVARELATSPALVVGWAREAIAASSLGEGLVVAVSSDLAASVDALEWGDLERLVTTDPALAPATAEIRDGKSVVTVGGGERLDLVAEQLAAVPARAA
jgi:flagellar biosynthesis/type III secretory pathway protein FliH